MAMAITKLVRNAKEKSFGSSLSRKACGEPQSAKLTVRGRASRSRHNSDVKTVLLIEQQTSDPISAGNINNSERGQNDVHALSMSV